MKTTYGSEYRPKGSGYEYSGSGSESEIACGFFEFVDRHYFPTLDEVH